MQFARLDGSKTLSQTKHVLQTGRSQRAQLNVSSVKIPEAKRPRLSVIPATPGDQRLVHIDVGDARAIKGGHMWAHDLLESECEGVQ